MANCAHALNHDVRHFTRHRSSASQIISIPMTDPISAAASRRSLSGYTTVNPQNTHAFVCSHCCALHVDAVHLQNNDSNIDMPEQGNQFSAPLPSDTRPVHPYLSMLCHECAFVSMSRNSSVFLLACKCACLPASKRRRVQCAKRILKILE